MNPNKLISPSGDRSKLSDEQKERLKKVRWQLKEHDEQTYEQWIANFEADMTPEREIRIWEAWPAPTWRKRPFAITTRKSGGNSLGRCCPVRCVARRKLSCRRIPG